MSDAPWFVDALAEVARRHPGRPAVVTAEEILTYAELMRRAERLASRLGGRPAVLARCAARVAEAVTAATIADVPLLVGDPKASEAERTRAAALFRADHILPLDAEPVRAPHRPEQGGTPEPGSPAGLGLSTSGSEGWPKCVERPWAAVTANSRAFAEALELSEGETLACTTPPHHSYALCGGIVTTLTAGATYVALDRQPGPRTVAAALDRRRVAVLLSVPLLYRWFSAGLSTRQRPRLCVSAGAPLPPEDRQRWTATVGWPIGEHYGTSEHGMLTLDTESVPGSVGRPLAGVTLGVDPAPGPGDVVVRCAGPATRVHTGGPSTGVTVGAPDGPTSTGDIGRLDTDGRLYLLGRRGGTLNVAGNKVSTVEVEEALRLFPAVRECAVVGAPGAVGDQEVVAFVETGHELDHRSLVSFLRGRLAPYKVPTRIVVVDRLPRNPNGKLLRSELLRGLADGTWR
ncbi:class I adenylate-forming enzyme family protein [Micromonospora halophytica]|uniref:Fatty acid CoA ligase FadD36 n=1 Tax=Micromonospora halophytica TaxID=47864 RepID=A0A1C5ILM7_9ACTN|nr:class I adenylate-forming enzyme family protein [Micromonospora halophytica]SCG59250.1 fatty acid CoA ligase FadD36 [Micromonospora halophytica]